LNYHPIDLPKSVSQPFIKDTADLERFMSGVRQGDKISVVFIRGTVVNTAEVTA
jgi:hypothetical protein